MNERFHSFEDASEILKELARPKTKQEILNELIRSKLHMKKKGR